MGFIDDLCFNGSNSDDRNGSAYIAVGSNYNKAKKDLVDRFNSGKSINYNDPGVQRVLTAFGASSVKELRHKLDL